jgi:hypothetical protein
MPIKKENNGVAYPYGIMFETHPFLGIIKQYTANINILDVNGGKELVITFQNPELSCSDLRLLISPSRLIHNIESIRKILSQGIDMFAKVVIRPRLMSIEIDGPDITPDIIAGLIIEHATEFY